MYEMGDRIRGRMLPRPDPQDLNVHNSGMAMATLLSASYRLQSLLSSPQRRLGSEGVVG